MTNTATETETTTTPAQPTEAELDAIREKIRSLDHDSFEDCNAFSEAFIEAVAAEDVATLIAADPLLGNLFCVIRQAAFEEGQRDVLDELRNVVSGDGGGISIVIGMITRTVRPRRDGDTTPSA